NTGLQLNIAANYGGRWDIMQAAQKLAMQASEGKIQPSDITEEAITKQLSMAHQSELDLLIRTGGDCRI
ncbi:di-trans,poly-cis-decaprenylcistransferase, partial [Pseudoalteromonas ruthenica]